MTNYRPLEYRKGFRTKNGKLSTGIMGMIRYTMGYFSYHGKKRATSIKRL